MSARGCNSIWHVGYSDSKPFDSVNWSSIYRKVKHVIVTCFHLSTRPVELPFWSLHQTWNKHVAQGLLYSVTRAGKFWVLVTEDSWLVVGSLKRVYIALREKRSVCVMLVTSSINSYLVPGDWIKIVALFFSGCRPSPGWTTLILFLFDC